MCDGWQQSPNFIHSMLMNCLPSFSVSSHLDLPAWNFWQKNLPPDRRHTSKLSRGGDLVSDAIWASYRETGEGRFRGKHTCPPRGGSRTHPRMRSPASGHASQRRRDKTRRGYAYHILQMLASEQARSTRSRATYLLYNLYYIKLYYKSPLHVLFILSHWD